MGGNLSLSISSHHTWWSWQSRRHENCPRISSLIHTHTKHHRKRHALTVQLQYAHRPHSKPQIKISSPRSRNALNLSQDASPTQTRSDSDEEAQSWRNDDANKVKARRRLKAKYECVDEDQLEEEDYSDDAMDSDG
jgi:hypothetical protein